MTEVRTGDRGELVVTSPRYTLEVAATGLHATLASSDGEHWATLRLLAALDTVEGPDETLAVAPPRLLEGPGVVITVERRSTRWEHANTTLACDDDAIDVIANVRGRGELTEAHLLAGRSVAPGLPSGFLPSGSSFQTLFSPNPGDPARLVRSAAESAVIGVTGDGLPGRGHWFFTPAPLSLWLTTDDVDGPAASSAGWVGLSLSAPVGELTFAQFEYVPGDRAFGLRVDYEGHTPVDGEFRAPTVVVTPGASDPYSGLRTHRADLVARGVAPQPTPREAPAWWREPIFCGWGAQCSLARTTGENARALSTQAGYDRFLSHLEAQGVVPGTVVIDDKWQAAYGTNEPDRDKWPDLRAWIASRHERGQRVLLWWKAWDAEGLEVELCIRNADGAPVAFDPSNPSARERLAGVVARMLGSDGLDADGLKIDFTARTPSGRSLTAFGAARGIALLHELLSIVYAAAKETKRDALLITHTPHPSFVDVTDMIRLNDMLRLDDPGPRPPVVPQMRYRAEVTRAACPELLIDTDDWCVPSLDEWRRYLDVKSLFGVPSLYYAESLDATGEQLEQHDYEALRTTWTEWRKTL
jgi:hypothetical protein